MAPPQFLAQRGDRLIFFFRRQLQGLGEFSVVTPRRGRVFRTYPPNHVIVIGVLGGILDHQPGFTQAPQTGDHLHGRGRATDSQRTVQCRQVVLAASEIGIRAMPAKFPYRGRDTSNTSPGPAAASGIVGWLSRSA